MARRFSQWLLSLALEPTGMWVYVQVDQLLEYHFQEDMTRLTQHCGKKVTAGRQTIIVSATLKDQVSCFEMSFLWSASHMMPPTHSAFG